MGGWGENVPKTPKHAFRSAWIASQVATNLLIFVNYRAAMSAEVDLTVTLEYSGVRVPKKTEFRFAAEELSACDLRRRNVLAFCPAVGWEPYTSIVHSKFDPTLSLKHKQPYLTVRTTACM